MSTAGLQTTTPLPLGLLLEITSFTLAAETGSVPINGQQAILVTTLDQADVATTVSLPLGLLLSTGGSTPVFNLSAGTGSVPITGQGATLLSAAPADVQTTMPLVLGLLLTATDFTLTAAAGAVVIDVAPSDGSPFTTPDPIPKPKGGGRMQHSKGSHHEEDEEVTELLTLIFTSGVLH